jgi:flagellar M-ring protein FliF
MDFLAKAYGQANDLLRGMSPGGRITAVLLLAVVVVSLTYLFAFHSPTPDDYLLGARPIAASDMAAMEGAFAKAGLSDYEIEGQRIRIPRGKRAAYLGALADAKAMPKDFLDHAQAAVADSGNVFESQKQREQRLKLAKQQELALIIRSMRDIEHATVQYDEIDRGGFPRRVEKVALVAVRPVGNAQLDDDRANGIIDLTVHAIAGLKTENVTVTDLNSGRAIGGGGTQGGVGGLRDDPYASRKRMYEQMWGDKIRSLLAFVQGAVVNVNVELDPEVHHRQDSVRYDPKVVALESTDASTTETSTQAQPQGRPGVVSNANVAQAVGTSGPASQSQRELTEAYQKNIAGHEQTSIYKAPLVPSRVTVSVAVPMNYLAKVWRERNPPAAGEEAKVPDPAELGKVEAEVKKKIEDAVVAQLPSRPAGTDPYPQVVVTTFQDLAAPTDPGPSMGQTASAWFADNWRTLGMLLVGGMGILFLRGMLRSVPAGPEEPTGQAPALSVVGGDVQSLLAGAGTGGEPKAGMRRKRLAAGGPSLRDEISEMVKEDPDAAANILKSWIGEAG